MHTSLLSMSLSPRRASYDTNCTMSRWHLSTGMGGESSVSLQPSEVSLLRGAGGGLGMLDGCDPCLPPKWVADVTHIMSPTQLGGLVVGFRARPIYPERQKAQAEPFPAATRPTLEDKAEAVPQAEQQAFPDAANPGRQSRSSAAGGAAGLP
jgi:hypothetical protein